jgi:hypothetical protein
MMFVPLLFLETLLNTKQVSHDHSLYGVTLMTLVPSCFLPSASAWFGGPRQRVAALSHALLAHPAE